MNQIAELSIKLSLEQDKFLRQLNGLSSKVKNPALAIGSQIIKSMGNVIRKGIKVIATSMIAILGTALATGIASINIASKFEREFSKVKAVTQATEEEARLLKRAIIDLSIDDRFVVSMEEANEAMLVLAKNGVSQTEIMNGALESTVSLSNALASDFGTSADIVTDAMNIFGIEADDMQGAVDGITGTVLTSKLELNDYRLALGQAGAIVAEAGIKFDEFNAILSGTASIATSGSDLGTSLKVMTRRVIPQTDQQEQALKKLGITYTNTEALAKTMADEMGRFTENQMKKFNRTLENGGTEMQAFRAGLGMTKAEFSTFRADTGIMQSSLHDLNGNFISTDNMVRTLARGTEDLRGQFQKTKVFGEAFGEDSSRIAVGLERLGRAIPKPELLERYARSQGIATDQLAFMASEARDGREVLELYAGALGMTRHELEDLGYELGFVTNDFRDSMSAIEKISALDIAITQVDNVAGAFQILRDQTRAFAFGIGNAFLPAIKGGLRVASALFKELLGPVLDLSEAFNQDLTVKVDEFLEVLNTPIDEGGGLMAAMESIGAGDFAKSFVSNFEEMKTKLQTFVEVFKEKLPEDGLRSALRSAFEEVSPEAVARFDRVAAVVERIQLAFGAETKSDFLIALGLKQETVENWENLRSKIVAIKNAFMQLEGSTVFDKMQSLFTSDGLQTFLEGLNIDPASAEAWTNLASAFKALAIAIFDIDGDAIEKLNNSLSGDEVAIENVQKWADRINFLADAITKFMEVVETIRGNVANFFGQMFGNAPQEDRGGSILDVIFETNRFSEFIKKFDEFFFAIGENIATWFNGLKEGVLGDHQKYWETDLPASLDTSVLSFTTATGEIGTQVTEMDDTVSPIMIDTEEMMRVTMPAATGAMASAWSGDMSTMISDASNFKTQIDNTKASLDSFLALDGRSVTIDYKINHINPEDTISNSPMRIHTRTKDFANYLKDTDFSLDLHSGFPDGLSAINAGIDETRANLSGLGDDLSSTTSGFATNVSQATGDVNSSVFNEGAVVIQLSRDEFESDDEFADFLLKRVQGRD